MQQTSKNFVAVLITAIIVGGSVYLWQQQSPTNNEQSQQVVSETKSKNQLPAGISEYHSPSGVRFRYPILTGRSNNENFPNLSGEFTFVHEKREGYMVIGPSKQPDFTHNLSVYKKSPDTSIQNAIKNVLKSTYPETKCTISVTESKPAPNGQLRFGIGAEPLSNTDFSQYGGECITVAQFVQYNPMRPDRFIVFTIGQDTFLDLSVIEDSLEIENQ